MRRCLVILLAWLLVASAPAVASPDPPIELGQGTKAQSLAFGAEGSLWFTADKYAYDGFTNVIGRVTPAGDVREFPLPKRNRTEIGGITIGPDGRVWFADTANDAIGRAGLDGDVTEFALARGSAPTGIRTGPDGAIWFTEAGSGQLGRIDQSGAIATISLPIGGHPLDLAVADGAFWVTENGRDAIAKVAPDGTLSEYPLPDPDSKPKAIVTGADGNLWFSEEHESRIGRISPTGEIVGFDVPGDVGGTGALAAAADGAIFFATGSRRAWIEAGSLSPTGALTGLGCVSSYCDRPVSALAVGPAGDLWYATDVRYTGGGGGGAFVELYTPGMIGRFQPPPPVAVSIPPQVLRVRGRIVHVAVSCQGAPQSRCGGAVQLESEGRGRAARRPQRAVYGVRPFSLAAGSTHRFALKISLFGMDILRHGPLRVTARATVHGGPEATARLTLHPPRRH
jgi:virginiamycin B lyase